MIKVTGKDQANTVNAGPVEPSRALINLASPATTKVIINELITPPNAAIMRIPTHLNMLCII